MSNAVNVRTRRTGLGFALPGFEYDPNIDWAGLENIFNQPPIVYSPPPATPPISGSNQPSVWSVAAPGLLGGVIKTIHDIFAPPAVSIAQAGQGYGANQYRNAQGQIVPYQPSPYQTPGVGIGIDSSGIRLSDGSHIGWTTIALVAGAFYLIQSPGFSRRRNPARRLNPKGRKRGSQKRSGKR